MKCIHIVKLASHVRVPWYNPFEHLKHSKKNQFENRASNPGITRFNNHTKKKKNSIFIDFFLSTEIAIPKTKISQNANKFQLNKTNHEHPRDGKDPRETAIQKQARSNEESSLIKLPAQSSYPYGSSLPDSRIEQQQPPMKDRTKREREIKNRRSRFEKKTNKEEGEVNCIICPEYFLYLISPQIPFTFLSPSKIYMAHMILHKQACLIDLWLTLSLGLLVYLIEC